MEAVRALVEHGANVNVKESRGGQTALMWAVSEGRLEVARLLIDRGALVNDASASGFTPLMFAARGGNVELARHLLSKGARINETAQDGASPLHVAVVRGHVELAELLLTHGADPNADKPGYTPLHWASGRWETGHSYDYNTVEEGEWSVLVGLSSGKIDMIKALLSRGADPNKLIVKAPPRFGQNLYRLRLIGATPFFLASITADVPMMRFLAANGADPAIPTISNITPLLAAAGLGFAGGATPAGTTAEAFEAVKLAYELGNDPKAVVQGGAKPDPSFEGATAMHGAATRGSDALVEWLAAKGPAPATKYAYLALGVTLLLPAGSIARDVLPLLGFSASAGAAVVLVLAAGALTVTGLLWLRRSGHSATQVLIAAVMVLAPFGESAGPKGGWTAVRYAGLPDDPGPRGAGDGGASSPRVVWIVMDELDEGVLTHLRPAGLELPAFAALRERSFAARNATSPGAATWYAIPSLLTGTPWGSAHPNGRRDLALEPTGGGDSVLLSSLETVFSDASESGHSAAAVGWFLPYCRLFPETSPPAFGPAFRSRSASRSAGPCSPATCGRSSRFPDPSCAPSTQSSPATRNASSSSTNNATTKNCATTPCVQWPTLRTTSSSST
jgi:ankyrin repeat protein